MGREWSSMIRLGFLLVLVALLAIPAPGWAAASFTSARNGSYRVTSPTDLAARAALDRLLAELNRTGRTWVDSGDEAGVRQWLHSSFGRFGVAADRIKNVVVLFPTRAREQTYRVSDPTAWVLLLTDPADEPQAIAFTVQRVHEEQAKMGEDGREYREYEGEGGNGGY